MWKDVNEVKREKHRVRPRPVEHPGRRRRQPEDEGASSFLHVWVVGPKQTAPDHNPGQASQQKRTSGRT